MLELIGGILGGMHPAIYIVVELRNVTRYYNKQLENVLLLVTVVVAEWRTLKYYVP